MAMDAKASSILSKLQNYDFAGIEELFSVYLHPISLLISPKPQHSKKPSKARNNHNRKQSKPEPEPETEQDPSSIRSLAKTFWPFIHQSLILLPDRLSESPKNPNTQHFITQLLNSYTLCLDCLDALSSQLSGKPYSVQLQRARFVNCLFRCQRYDKAVDEGFRVLKSLGGVKLQGFQCKVTMGELVPRLIHDGDGAANAVDVEFVRIIVDTVFAIVTSVSISKTKDAGKYTALLILINEVRPLLRYSDPCVRTKLQLKLLACMKNAMKFLITEVKHFEGDLIPEFCKATFNEYLQLLNSENNQDSMGKEVEEFVEFVSSTAYRSRSASAGVRVAIAMHMHQSAYCFSKGLAYFSLIQRLYSIGLYLSEFSLQPHACRPPESTGTVQISSVQLSPECWDKLGDLSALLASGKKYHRFNLNDYDKRLRCKDGDFIAQVSPYCACDHKDSKSCMSENEANYLPYYLNALKFLCWPLAEFVNSQRKSMVVEKGESALGDVLKLIHEALLEYCYLFTRSQRGKGAHGQIDSIVILIFLAAFTLSLKLNFNIKGSKWLMDYLLSDNCIQTFQPKHLKTIISGLRNIFVEFYKDNQLKEASKAGKLCCRASWNHCLLLCEMLAGKLKGFDGELSEPLITASLSEACKISSLLADVLHQLDSHKLEKVLVHSLEKWSLARNLFRDLPSPVALIKCWVEIQCKLHENTGASAPVLGSYLMCSPCMTKHNSQTEAVGIILEQELLDYQGMHKLYPKCSQRMQMEIIDILLKYFLDSSNCRRRADVLVKKGMLYRARGMGGLENCIHSLSEAIESINNSYGITGVTHEEAAAMSHQLAIIYCLRAMSTQEANPSSKDMFNDIRQAVNLWLTTDIPDCLSVGLCDIGCEYMLLLLYHIADLLSIKGEMMIHSDVFNVIIRVFKRMDASLEKCLSLMWESRRFNHALCAVPLNEAFITVLSGHYGKDAESLDFWINSMESPPLVVGLLQNFSYLSTLFPLAFHQHMRSLCSESSVDQVKQTASDLVSKVSMSGHAAFQAGYLYHDLSQRLYASGHMIEALVCAKEAYQLRNNLFLKHFSFSIEHCGGEQGQDGITINLTVLNRIAMRAWPGNAISQNSESFILTQWNVLQCYLESTMQVGIIHEALGNVADAKRLFEIGKQVSRLLGLPAFIVAFSSCLGKTYLGRCLLDAAHMELGSAEEVLASERNLITCSKCLLMLESSIMEQLGNLYRKGGNSYRKAVDTAAGSPYEFSIKRLLSLEEDDLAVWLEEANSAHTMLQDKVAMDEGSGFGQNIKTNDAAAALLGVGCPAQLDKTRTKTEAKRSRKMKKVSESVAAGSCCAIDQNSRVTRSRKHSSQSNSFSCTERAEDISSSNSKPKQDCEATSISNMVNCQKCFSDELINYSSVSCVIQMKWEFMRRREILRLLIGLGKSEGASAGIPRLYKIYSKCISMLGGGNDCKCLSSLELECFGKEIPGDVLAVERAEICYNLCWLSLRALYSKDSSRSVSWGSCLEMSQIISLLMLSFVLSREIPPLFEKVSRLLALTHVVSSVRDNVAYPVSSKQIVSANYWAAYFHQASIGAHHNLQLLSANTLKRKAQSPCKVKGSEADPPISMTADTFTLRFVPESVKEIERCVENFFQNLPSATIVCISFLGDSCAGLLEDVMHHPSASHEWMFLSHLDADNQPAATILPLTSILQDEETSSNCSVLGEKYFPKKWCSPWGCSAVVDDVVPLFNHILRENYASSSNIPEEDTEKNRQVWWSWRESLDKCLRKLLRDMEDSWFGAWRYLLLGQLTECEPLDSVVRELVQEIKLRYQYDVNEGVLKLVLRGIKPANLENKGIPSLFLRNGCYIGCIEDHHHESCSSQNKAYYGADYVPAGIIELMLAAVNKLEAEYCTRREPVILVLDTNVQMLPLENMPILREQEVYRMPSVAIILATLQRRSILEEAVGHASRFPLIDPLDAFYLLNPSGDLSRTQAEFEEWFRLLNMQGKAGVVPSTEELIGALENHDLFYYFGHGSGSQYILPEKIQKLEKCAAILLMGCSSGSLKLNGDYPPAGPSLSYVLSGSPIVVANLWEVTDGEIDRFAKAVLKAFLDERSMSSSGCIQCSMLAEGLNSMSVNERKGNTKKGRGRRKKPESDESMLDISSGYCFRHKLRTGYFVSKARNACKLPFLIGAAPVCYGVPTGIRKKTGLQR